MFDRCEKKEFKLSLLELDLVVDIITQHLENYPTKKDASKVEISLLREGNGRITILYNE